MTILDIMTPAPATCGPSDSLAQIAERMWDADCGIVPVVDDAGRVTGVITDRDICIATATRDLAPSALTAADMAPRHVITCAPEDDVHAALELMKRHRVRRLPVVTDQGFVHGIVSLDDIALSAGPGRGAVTAIELAAAMKAILDRRLPARHAAA